MSDHNPCIEAKELCRTCRKLSCGMRSPLVSQCTLYEPGNMNN